MEFRRWIKSHGSDIFPLLRTIREYSPQKFVADIRAALNVALLDFPQGMAYALLAGLPVQIGVFCSSLASITGPFFASSRFVMLGPTNATAVMLLSAFLTLGYTMEQSVVALPVLVLMVGCFMIIGSFFKVAGITQYISRAVVVGYITAAACLIIVNQLKTVCGLHVPRAGTVVESLYHFVNGIGQTNLAALAAGTLTVILYYLGKKFLPALPTVALTLVVMSLLAACAGLAGFELEMLSSINARDWPVSLPSFKWSELNVLANTALAVAFLSLLESSSISKTLAAQAGDRINLNQQMLSMGTANLVCAFGSGMTVSGSLTRSVLNYRSGAQTSLSSIYSGCLLITGLFLLGNLVGWIPRPVLAALVITVGISLFNIENIRIILKTTKSDATVFLVTLVSGLLLSLDTAIYLGAGASLILFIRKVARPQLKEISIMESGEFVESEIRHQRPEITIVHVEGDLFFASSDVFHEQIRRLAEHTTQKAIILRLRNAYHLDATAVMSIKELVLLARQKDCHILVSGAHEEVELLFRKSGLMDTIGEANFFRHNPENLNISTRNALKRARELTGIDSADITIFAAKK